ncbi:hypothetical protein [Nocardioides panzhihuensis]|uniref:Uncharacterized protein n=1 Tax=Nocardioides panzhihuensis TaxID=860243 RepID=A0A7Z0ISD5_9ACTN|nr:hypothetical protein [Nocardioides panzhihuensis]NYI77944.1 hypothetical protein [Nocardioides panzhihuensis]
MHIKQVAIAGILAGAVMTGLGAIVLVAGLAGGERPDRDPLTGYEGVEDTYPDVDPLPPIPAAKLSEEPSTGAPARPGGAAEDHHGTIDDPGEPSPTMGADPNRPKPPRELAEPGRTAGSTPTSDPTRTSEPEPTAEPTDPAEPTAEPTPTETASPSEEPQSQSLGRTGG